jgi:hypothetical protein
MFNQIQFFVVKTLSVSAEPSSDLRLIVSKYISD